MRNRTQLRVLRLSLPVLVAMLAMLTSAGCMDMGGSGRLVWYEGETIDTGDDGGTPIIPELPSDDPDSPIPLPPGDPADDGDPAADAYVPQVDFSFEESAYRTMAERSITATFEDAVDDCGTEEVNDLIRLTDAVDVPIEASYEIAWNESCTACTFTNVPLTYFTTYKIVMQQGLSFEGQVLNANLTHEFTTPANYYSINAGRFAGYPTTLAETWGARNRSATIYSGDDMMPDVLPRDPLSFTREDVTPVFEYADGEADDIATPLLNAGEGRFIFSMWNAILLWRDLSLAPVTLSIPTGDWGSDVQSISVTDQSNPDAASFNGNDVQDLVFGVYNMDADTFEVYVFYDWPNDTADLSYADADWSLIAPAEGYGSDIGDFNGDGIPDICLTNVDGETESQDIECYLGGASGISLSPVVKFIPRGVDQPFTMRMGEVNCDGFSDVVFGAYSMDEMTAADEGVIAILPGGTDLTGLLRIGVDQDILEALRIESTSTEFGLDIRVNDLDGDGCSDIFTLIDDEPTMIQVFQGDATITYGNAQTVAADTAANLIFVDPDVSRMREMMTSLDINGDGYNDFMYDEFIVDYDLGVWEHQQIFVEGGPDFFSAEQTTISRDDASSQLIDYSGLLAK